MKILALDTATKVASVAILEDDRVIAEKIISTNQNHSEIVLGLISDTLEEAKITLKDIEAFAISNGPGSFTGLRVASATIKAFAQAENNPIYEICTLDSLAKNVTLEFEEATIFPIIDARRKQVYYGVYNLENNEIEQIADYGCEDFVKVLEMAKNYKNVVFVGDGVELYKDVILESGFKVVSENNINAKASILQVGVLDKNLRNYKSTKLFYFKKSQAESELEEKLKNDKNR